MTLIRMPINCWFYDHLPNPLCWLRAAVHLKVAPSPWPGSSGLQSGAWGMALHKTGPGSPALPVRDHLLYSCSAAESFWPLGPKSLRSGEAGQQLERGERGGRLLVTLQNPSLGGNVTRTMLILSRRSHTLTPLGSSILRSLLHDSSLKTCEGPLLASSILPCLGRKVRCLSVLIMLFSKTGPPKSFVILGKSLCLFGPQLPHW